MKLHQINNFNEYADHMYDDYTSLGYDYHKSILERSVSSEMFANPLTDVPYRQFEKLIAFLVDQVKRIKLQYAIALDKNSKLLN